CLGLPPRHGRRPLRHGGTRRSAPSLRALPRRRKRRSRRSPRSYLRGKIRNIRQNIPKKIPLLRHSFGSAALFCAVFARDFPDLAPVCAEKVRAPPVFAPFSGVRA